MSETPDADGDQTGETWVGASPAEKITYTYDADNELTGATDAYATLTFTYDSGGNELTSATSGPGTGQPSVTLTSTYNPQNNLASVTDNVSGNVGITTYLYDAGQRLTTITTSYGGTAGPEIITSYAPNNQISAQSRTIGGSGTAVNASYSYDAGDRQTTITDYVSGGVALATGIPDTHRFLTVTHIHPFAGRVFQTHTVLSRYPASIHLSPGCSGNHGLFISYTQKARVQRSAERGCLRNSVTDDHTIAGNINSQSESGPTSTGWTDSGNDASNRNAHGTKGTSGDTFSFTEGETGSDIFSLGKSITGTLDGSAQITASFGFATTGSRAGSSFSRCPDTHLSGGGNWVSGISARTGVNRLYGSSRVPVATNQEVLVNGRLNRLGFLLDLLLPKS